MQHCNNNDVDLSATPLALGPQLAVRGRDEVFTGSDSEAANAMLFRGGRGEFTIPTEAQV